MLGRRGEESGTIEGLGGWQWKKEECHVEVELRWWLNANTFFCPCGNFPALRRFEILFHLFSVWVPYFFMSGL